MDWIDYVSRGGAWAVALVLAFGVWRGDLRLLRELTVKDLAIDQIAKDRDEWKAKAFQAEEQLREQTLRAFDVARVTAESQKQLALSLDQLARYLGTLPERDREPSS